MSESDSLLAVAAAAGGAGAGGARNIQSGLTITAWSKNRKNAAIIFVAGLLGVVGLIKGMKNALQTFARPMYIVYDMRQG